MAAMYNPTGPVARSAPFLGTPAGRGPVGRYLPRAAEPVWLYPWNIPIQIL